MKPVLETVVRSRPAVWSPYAAASRAPARRPPALPTAAARAADARRTAPAPGSRSRTERQETRTAGRSRSRPGRGRPDRRHTDKRREECLDERARSIRGRLLPVPGRHAGPAAAARRPLGPSLPGTLSYGGLGIHVRPRPGGARGPSRCSRSSPCGSGLERRAGAVRLAAAARSSRASGVLAGPGVGAPARRRIRAPDGGSRADDRREHRFHHRALRRLHAADRARRFGTPVPRRRRGPASRLPRRAAPAERRARADRRSGTCSCSRTPSPRRCRSRRWSGSLRATTRGPWRSCR